MASWSPTPPPPWNCARRLCLPCNTSDSRRGPGPADPDRHQHPLPVQGDASYYGVTTSAGDTVDDVIWTYEDLSCRRGDRRARRLLPHKAEISVKPD